MSNAPSPFAGSGSAFGVATANPEGAGPRTTLEALGLAPGAPESPPANKDGLYGYVISFFEDLGRSIKDENLRAAGYDPDVERFHRALIAADPAQRLPGAPTGDDDKDCRVHDQIDPDGNQERADRIASLKSSIDLALAFAGGKGGGGAAAEGSMMRLLARAERRPILEPQPGCFLCQDSARSHLGMMKIPGPRLVRNISRGEKVTDLVDELVRRTRETGNEHGVFALTTGERVIIEGGPNEIALPRGTRRVIAHTHPDGTRFASPEDKSTLVNGGLGLAEKGQQHSYIVAIERDGAKVIRFDKPKPVDWAKLEAILDAQFGSTP